MRFFPNTPAWLARHQLESFEAQTQAAIAAAEQAIAAAEQGVKEYGRPPKEDMEAWKRRGRTLYQLRLKRALRPAIGREYDQCAGRTHLTTLEKCACYNEVQRGDPHDRLADAQGGTRRRVGHPRGQCASRSVRQLAEQQLVVATRHATIYAGNLAVEWVPAVVDGDFFRSFSRM